MGSWIVYRLGNRLLNARITRVLWFDREAVDGQGDGQGDRHAFRALSAGKTSQSPACERAAAGGLTFRFLTAGEVRHWAADPANDLDADMAARLDSGRDFCFAALAGERLAGYAWFALGQIEPEHSAGAGISYPDDVAYLYKGYVHAGFRGRRLYAAIFSEALGALASRGVRRLLCLVEWINRPALRSCLGSGWVDLGSLVTFGYGRRRLAIAPRAAEERGVKFGCRPRATMLYCPWLKLAHLPRRRP